MAHKSRNKMDLAGEAQTARHAQSVIESYLLEVIFHRDLNLHRTYPVKQDGY